MELFVPETQTQEAFSFVLMPRNVLKANIKTNGGHAAGDIENTMVQQNKTSSYS